MKTSHTIPKTLGRTTPKTDFRALRQATRKHRGAAAQHASLGGRARRMSQPGSIRWLEPSDIVFDNADVIIIGGGATGIGLLWDLTLRGLDVILLEQAGLASGTSGAFHGLLHSGARYAGSDPATAAECLSESRVLKSVARAFVQDTGGVFVRLEGDDEAWEAEWLAGCRSAGLRPARLRPQDLLGAEPLLSPSIVSAYRTPDAAIDGFGLLWSILWASANAGARIYFRSRVTGFLTDEAGVRGVTVVGLGGPEDAAASAVEEGRLPKVEPGEITASAIVNATGPWAGETAALAGPEAAWAVPVEKDKGTMIVWSTRLSDVVVNRLRPPGDGDIFVPHGPISILGTTSSPHDGLGRPRPALDDIRTLLREGQKLIPSLGQIAPLRAYAGVRPLVRQAAGAGPSAGRASAGGLAASAVSAGRGTGRGFLLIDHSVGGNLAGLVTVVGGKFTTFRAMAEATGDLVVRLLGKASPSRTASVGIPRLRLSPRAVPSHPGPSPLGGGDAVASLACECELVSLPYFDALVNSGLNLADIRRVARVGMGSCQGVFCRQRLAGALWDAGWPGSRQRPRLDIGVIEAEASAFADSRKSGTKAVAWGAEARLRAIGRTLTRLSLGEENRE